MHQKFAYFNSYGRFTLFSRGWIYRWLPAVRFGARAINRWKTRERHQKISQWPYFMPAVCVCVCFVHSFILKNVRIFIIHVAFFLVSRDCVLRRVTKCLCIGDWSELFDERGKQSPSLISHAQSVESRDSQSWAVPALGMHQATKGVAFWFERCVHLNSCGSAVILPLSDWLQCRLKKSWTIQATFRAFFLYYYYSETPRLLQIFQRVSHFPGSSI